MEKISRENVDMVAIKRPGGPRARATERIYEQLGLLEIGEAITITRKEWGIKSSPRFVVNKVAENRGWNKRFKVHTFEDDTGWLIKRTK
jgi:hypothetical protein